MKIGRIQFPVLLIHFQARLKKKSLKCKGKPCIFFCKNFIVKINNSYNTMCFFVVLSCFSKSVLNLRIQFSFYSSRLYLVVIIVCSNKIRVLLQDVLRFRKNCETICLLILNRYNKHFTIGLHRVWGSFECNLY